MIKLLTPVSCRFLLRKSLNLKKKKQCQFDDNFHVTWRNVFMRIYYVSSDVLLYQQGKGFKRAIDVGSLPEIAQYSLYHLPLNGFYC